MKLLSIAALAAVSLATAGSAHAAGTTNGFGEKGQLIITGDRLLPVFGYARSSITTTQNGRELTDSQTGAGFNLLLGRDLGLNGVGPVNVHTLPRVAFDVTIIHHLTLGAAFAFGFGLGGTVERELVNGTTVTTAKNDAPTASAIGLAPRVGYVIPLSNVFAFWPRAGFAFYAVSSKTEDVDNGATRTTSVTDTLFSIDLDPQFVIVPVEHFFFHAGPLVNIPLTGTRSTESTNGPQTVTVDNDISVFHLGLTAGIGGWLNVF